MTFAYQKNGYRSLIINRTSNFTRDNFSSVFLQFYILNMIIITGNDIASDQTGGTDTQW